jgi:hypothetical protein
MLIDNSIRIYYEMRNAEKSSVFPVPEYTWVKYTYTTFQIFRERKRDEKAKPQRIDHNSPEQ